MKFKYALIFVVLLVIPLVNADLYIIWFTSYEVPLELYNKDNHVQRCGDKWCWGFTEMGDRCLEILFSINDLSYYKDLKLIRVWDNHPKVGQPAGLWFHSGIIHIYDGCRNPGTLIHELAHQDRKSAKHNSFFWLSYYRIRLEVKNEI